MDRIYEYPVGAVMQIEIEMDRVFIEGQEVLRPPNMARSTWLALWESFVNKECKCNG